jgi:hypothetical protein
MKEDTLTRVAALLQAGGEFDMALFPALSQACAAEVAQRLKPGADPETDSPDAYALAISLLMRAKAAVQSPSPTAYTLGDLSVSGLGQEAGANDLRQEAFRLLKGYVYPAGFAFVGVRS